MKGRRVTACRTRLRCPTNLKRLRCSLSETLHDQGWPFMGSPFCGSGLGSLNRIGVFARAEAHDGSFLTGAEAFEEVSYGLTDPVGFSFFLFNGLY